MQQQQQQQQQVGGMEELFQAYGVRHLTASKIAELGFTVNTLIDMKEEELDDMMNTLSHIFRWDLMVGERYGIKAAIRAHRRRLDHLLAIHSSSANAHSLDSLSQEGLSEEPVLQLDTAGDYNADGRASVGKLKPPRRQRKRSAAGDEDDEDDEEEDEEYSRIRQREHPFIVTEPGEVARGKKNGLDYLFHLYDQCRDFLIQVQNMAKDRGEKCPTKVTNQVFRFAKKAGASYINKPKMRHYVHCYALHCLDEAASDALRRAFKERGENVGAWRQACYQPLVAMAGRHGWDIDALFNSHPRLSIWYVPTRLRQLCHAQRHLIAAHAAAPASTSSSNPPPPHLPF